MDGNASYILIAHHILDSFHPELLQLKSSGRVWHKLTDWLVVVESIDRLIDR